MNISINETTRIGHFTLNNGRHLMVTLEPRAKGGWLAGAIVSTPQGVIVDTFTASRIDPNCSEVAKYMRTRAEARQPETK